MYRIVSVCTCFCVYIFAPILSLWVLLFFLCSWNTAERGAMAPPVEDTIPAVQSSVPLLSRRRGTLSNSSSSVKNDASDMELGAVEEGDSSVSVRIKTAGDGREYNVSSSLTSTVAQVCSFVDGSVVKTACYEVELNTGGMNTTYNVRTYVFSELSVPSARPNDR